MDVFEIYQFQFNCTGNEKFLEDCQTYNLTDVCDEHSFAGVTCY